MNGYAATFNTNDKTIVLVDALQNAMADKCSTAASEVKSWKDDPTKLQAMLGSDI